MDCTLKKNMEHLAIFVYTVDCMDSMSMKFPTEEHLTWISSNLLLNCMAVSLYAIVYSFITIFMCDHHIYVKDTLKRLQYALCTVYHENLFHQSYFNLKI